jgi:hypothetical protein
MLNLAAGGWLGWIVADPSYWSLVPTKSRRLARLANVVHEGPRDPGAPEASPTRPVRAQTNSRSTSCAPTWTTFALTSTK